MSPRLTAFVAAVVVTGVAVLVHSAMVIGQTPFSIPLVLLAVLTIASSRFVIKVPGRPAIVSVSEVFVFASMLLYGPAAATLTVAIDGAWLSATQKNRRLYRTLFNIAEPAISTWTAAYVFRAIARTSALFPPSADTPTLVLATIGMTAVFFVLNSGLTSVALALENRTSPYEVWRTHAWYLAINYYAAASLATLAVGNASTPNLGAIALIAPLVVLSYVAYREATTRVDEAQRHVGDVERLYRAAVDMLAIAVDVRDQLTHGHVCRVQRYTLAVAKALGVTNALDLEAIEAGALLHDIGKLAVPDHVLNKPSVLTRADYEIMKKHASIGARILTAVDFPYPIVPIVRHHHEQWDGGGYPDGLVGTEIPFGARVLAVVDCFDALTSDRPYRQRLSDERAIEILRARKGKFYDPAVVEKFIELIPALQHAEVALRDDSNARGAMVVGLVRTVGECSRQSDAEAALSTTGPLGQRARALIDTRVARIVAADACLYAINPGGDLLLVAHATSRLHDRLTLLQLPVGAGVSGWVAANRITIRNADPVLDIGELAEELGLRTCTCTPVFARGDLVGVLTVYGTQAAGFPENTVADIGILAQEVGLVISRPREEPTLIDRTCGLAPGATGHGASHGLTPN